MEGKNFFVIVGALIVGAVVLAKYVIFPFVQSASETQLSSPMLAEADTAMDISSSLDSAAGSGASFRQDRPRASAPTEPAQTVPGPPIDVRAVRDILQPERNEARPEALLIQTNLLVLGDEEYRNVVIKEVAGRYLMKHSGGVKWLTPEELSAVTNALASAAAPN